jgi:hypothetical protein
MSCFSYCKFEKKHKNILEVENKKHFKKHLEYMGAGKKTGLSEIRFIGNGHIGNRYI